MICGIANGAVVHRPVQLRKFCWNSNTSPMSSPPMNVSGRLFSRPMIAAANAARISRVSVCDVEGGELLGEEDAGDRGHRRAERPREHRDAAGLDAVEAGELAVVDDRAHRDAEARAGEQDLEAERETEARRRW